MGIAYILQVLDQWSLFDSLHWFQSVRDMYRDQIKKIQKQKSETSEEKLDQTLALTLKRLDTYEKEFRLLYFGLSSARIFFRMSSDASESSQEEGDENAKENSGDGNDDEEEDED